MKEQIKQLFIRNRYFIIPQLVFLLTGLVLLLLFSKTDLHLRMNEWHTNFLDVFFRYLTLFGSGYIYIPVFLMLFYKEIQWMVLYLLSLASSNLLLLLFKQVVFEDFDRPLQYFSAYPDAQLHLIEGVDMHHFHSFPSGHTTTAFTVFFFLAIMCRRNTVKAFLFVVALLTAFSRVYLSQHFFEDILAGSVLGTGMVILSYSILLVWRRSWMDKYFIQIFDKKTDKIQ